MFLMFFKKKKKKKKQNCITNYRCIIYNSHKSHEIKLIFNLKNVDYKSKIEICNELYFSYIIHKI